MNVVLTAPARRELSDAAGFYARQSGAAVARSFVDAFDHAVVMLREHPRIGAIWLGRYRRSPLDRFPYSIMYRITATDIRVLAVAHQGREPGYWLGRTE